MELPISRTTMARVKTIALTFLLALVVFQGLIILGLSNVEPSSNVISHANGAIVWDSTNVLIFDSTANIINSTIDVHGSVVQWGDFNQMKGAKCIPLEPGRRS